MVFVAGRQQPSASSGFLNETERDKGILMTSLEPIDHADEHSTSSDAEITLTTIAQYLVGSRTAILLLAENTRTVWLGLLFVISAGFAREYDGEDLWSEPWHLLLPLVASLVTSLLLFLLVYLLSLRRHANVKNVFMSFRTFLGLYWLTAPLAWLYAIPVERFLSAANSAGVNFWLLGIVALWRVILIIRVITVLFNARIETVLPVVMLFADSVLLLLLAYMPRPILAVMGGVRITDSEMTLATLSFLVHMVGMLAFPFWVIGSFVVFCFRQPAWSYQTSSGEVPRKIPPSVWAVALLSILVWIFILPFTQPEQRLRFQVERALRTGQLQEGVALMRDHRLEEFPPHWDPPPRLGYHERTPPIIDLVEIVAEGPDDWVRHVYLDKFQRQLASDNFWMSSLRDMEDNERLKVLSTVELMLDNELSLTDPESLKNLMFSLAQIGVSDETSWKFPHISDKVRKKAKEIASRLNDVRAIKRD